MFQTQVKACTCWKIPNLSAITFYFVLQATKNLKSWSTRSHWLAIPKRLPKLKICSSLCVDKLFINKNTTILRSRDLPPFQFEIPQILNSCCFPLIERPLCSLLSFPFWNAGSKRSG